MKRSFKCARNNARNSLNKATALGNICRFALKWSAVVAIWCTVIIVGITIFLAHDLPNIDSALSEFRKPAITLIGADGSKIKTIGVARRTVVQHIDLPVHLPQAIIATEDRRFFTHIGIDLVGIVRAAVANFQAGRIIQGGSTITQQAAKNLFLTSDRTVKRKIQEILLAFWLEYNFTKSQIFTIYVNRVYLGAGTYGVESAAQKYFGSSAISISLHQSALLAGLLKAPSKLNPILNPKGAAKRARQVLANMVSAGYVDSRAAEGAVKKPLGLKRPKNTERYGQYFIDWVVEQIPSYVGSYAGDITVKTTLEPRIQMIAESKLEEILSRFGKQFNVSQGAFIALTPDGAIRALVGGKNYGKSQFNRATQARRQPGSAFKPFVYLAGLETGLSPNTKMLDKPIRYGKWQPRNYTKKYKGVLTLSEALETSSNSIAVQVAKMAGVKKTIAVAKRLGVSSPMRADLSIALGSSEVSLLDLTTAYVAFANGGKAAWAHGIDQINGLNGKLLYRRRGSGTGQVIAKHHVYELNQMLSGAITRGTGKNAKIDRPAAGKTGTSQEYRDAWFVGYTGNYVAGVWFGNDNRSPMKRVTGGGLPARLWKSVMKVAHQGLIPRPLPGLANSYDTKAVSERKINKSIWERVVNNLTAGWLSQP